MLIYSHCQHRDIFMLLLSAEISQSLGCRITHKDYSLDVGSLFATISTLLANDSTEPCI